MRRLISLKAAVALAGVVGLLAFVAGSYLTPTPATATAPRSCTASTSTSTGR